MRLVKSFLIIIRQASQTRLYTFYEKVWKTNESRKRMEIFSTPMISPNRKERQALAQSSTAFTVPGLRRNKRSGE